jgi:hypothetical protein
MTQTRLLMGSRLCLAALLLGLPMLACTMGAPDAASLQPTTENIGVSVADARVALQVTQIPSITPLGAPPAPQRPYGSVGASVSNVGAQSAPLNQSIDSFSAQSVGQPAAQSFATQPVPTSAAFPGFVVVTTTLVPGATGAPPTVVIAVPTVIIAPPGGSTVPTVPTIGEETGNLITGFINGIIIPVINFLISATYGTVVYLWEFMGRQFGFAGQFIGCVVIPSIGAWWYFFRRRRRRR